MTSSIDPATGQPYVCPAGGQFGVNTMELTHCEQCHLFQPCVDENERLLARTGPTVGHGGTAAPVTAPGNVMPPPPVTGHSVPPGPMGVPPSTVPGGPIARTPVGTGRGEPVGTGGVPTPGGRQLVT